MKKLGLLLQRNQTTVAKQPLILAVDDDEDNLMLLIEVLRSFDCAFITATHGQTALEAAQSYQPDLILLDVMLPDFNGMEVVHQLKHNPQTSCIPVVAVTALARTQDRENLLMAGCDDYISKPYMLDELESLISRHLNWSKSIT